MKHLLDISQLTPVDINRLIQRATELKQRRIYPSYPLITMVNLFYEPSTRTRVSFELAAHHLSMKVVNVSVEQSSESKGEVIEDTINTLSAMGIGLFVIRHKADGMPAWLASRCKAIQLINAGDGQHAHPSQALLDLMTIIEQKPNLSELKIAIVGNLRHSRVAKSLHALFVRMGVGNLTFIAPHSWLPENTQGACVTTSLQEGLTDADVVICLRVQRERLLADESMDLQCFRRDYAITEQSLLFAKPNAMVMHPGPMNRGIEIDSQVADGSQSFILHQVQNGVFMRMAILDSLSQTDTTAVFEAFV